jgi:hypothetical protein
MRTRRRERTLEDQLGCRDVGWNETFGPHNNVLYSFPWLASWLAAWLQSGH